jgi:hypothetical protein
MDKRYQIFISSTFVDLREERDIAVQTIMGLDCIPAGMELFPAADLEQFEYIKKVIDECDYYLLIIGGKYGSVTEEGVSYTEKEYEYAISQGIKVMAFLHEAPEALPVSKSETNETGIRKLTEFRETASKGRLVEFWQNKDQLAGKIALTIPKTIKLFPATGWVRADKVSSNELLIELNELKNTNAELNNKIETLSEYSNPNTNELASLDDFINIAGTYPIVDPDKPFSTKAKQNDFSINLCINKIFRKLAPKLERGLYEKGCLECIDECINQEVKINFKSCNEGLTQSIKYDKDILIRFKYHFISLGLISAASAKSTGGDYFIYWNLTNVGRKILTQYLSFNLEEVKADLLQN